MNNSKSLIDSLLWTALSAVRIAWRIRHTLLPLVIFCAMTVLPDVFPEMTQKLFLIPSGIAASVLLGRPITENGGFSEIITQHGTLRLVESCSGYGFFTILFCMFFFIRSKKLGLGECVATQILWTLPIYLSSIFINGCRITASLYTASFAGTHLPTQYHTLVHSATGLLIFIPVLCALYNIYGGYINENRFHGK